jgi:hypothetical protein
MKQTTKFAFGIAAVKSILPRIVKLLKNPLTIPETFVKKFDYRLFMFFVSMNGIFKVTFEDQNKSKSRILILNFSIC